MTQAQTPAAEPFLPKTKRLLARLGVSALLAAAVLAPAAAKADPAHDYRRTLFISFGQKSLLLEAPRGMCFLDQSDYLQSGLLSFMQIMASHAHKRDSVPMAIFGDCNEVMSLGTQSQGPLGLAHRGIIYWKKTAENGGRSKLDLSDYLDMREASMLQEVKDDINLPFDMVKAAEEKTEQDKAKDANAAKKDGTEKSKVLTAAKAQINDKQSITTYLTPPEDYKLPGTAHRTASSVSVGYTDDTEIEYQKFRGTAVLGTTLIRHIPIDVLISYMEPKRSSSVDDMYALMDTFMEQQQRLNRE
jgi:hypothetical protein